MPQNFKTLFLMLLLSLTIPFIQITNSQTIAVPTILEVVEDDRVATIYWNSKTNTYNSQYDPDKQNGVFSYLVEWGTTTEGFVHASITSSRVIMIQPLEPGETYVVRVFNLDNHGHKSVPSEPITFSHNGSRVDSMRTRLNGFFDDMNYPMGAFPEKDWNQSYSGCMKIGRVSQHINNQYHGHNVQSSSYCDRGVATSRVRHLFDFTDRTGTIEFDLDGSQKGRQFWYLDLMPAERKRDLTGHIHLHGGDAPQADPPHLLRILQKGRRVSVQMVDADGYLHSLDNIYENGACGEDMRWCNGENLSPVINVRRRWKIELSKTHVKIFINEILVVDCSLIAAFAPEGLPYEVANVNWLTFSYNTPKENFLLSMIHWDNFGFDAPDGYEQTTEVHNYTDGILGTESPRIGNDFSNGMYTKLIDPGFSTIVIPDSLKDQTGADPISTELMFTIQGSDYAWTAQDHVIINGVPYPFAEPTSTIVGFPISELTKSAVPYSAILPIDANDLIVGNNQIEFYLNNAKLLNIHVELIFPIQEAPSYTAPQEVYADHLMKLMGFRSVANTMGPGIIFSDIDGFGLWQNEFVGVSQPTPDIYKWFVKQTAVSDSIPLSISGNLLGQLAATGKAKGIAYYEIWMDQKIIHTVRTDIESAVGYFEDMYYLDTRQFSNGTHQLFVKAFDVEGNPSSFDKFESSISPGEYVPVIIDIQNQLTDIDVHAIDESITLFPNPSDGIFQIVGQLSKYEVTILAVNGIEHQNISTVGSTITVDINALPSGIYFVRISNLENIELSLQKIIKL